MPVLNHRDYRSAKARIAQLGHLIGPSRVLGDIAAQLSASVATARQEALKAELERLTADVEAYEKLRGTSLETEAGLSADDLGLLPILARIARRLSQRELAERLGLKEQQVQRYESERYSGIGLARYEKILAALGVEVQPRLMSEWPSEEAAKLPAEEKLEIPADIAKEIRKRSWVQIPQDIKTEEAAAIIEDFVKRAMKLSDGRFFNRQGVSRRPNADAKPSELATMSWRARVLDTASTRSKPKTKFNIADTSWLKSLVTLSVYPDGPVRAAELLHTKGIIVIAEPHLPHTLLDGAALLLLDTYPIVALTLRHDRLDNFWFTLLHELGHIFLHFNHGLAEGFLDNLDENSEAAPEQEADSFARTYLLSDEVWNSSPARFAKSDDLIKKFAESLSIHPAIVAGRIRRDRSNYRIFDELVGHGQVRQLFFAHPH